MLYDCLREAQKEDELLQAFLIKFVDKQFALNSPEQEKNQIYIVRRGSIIHKRGYDYQEFDVDLDIYILIKEYDEVMASRILKTMYKNIMHHIVNDPVGAYIKVDSFHFEYREQGILDCAVISFVAHEVEDFQYDYDLTPIRIALGLDISIMGQNRHHIPYNPKPLKKKQEKLHPTKYKPRIVVPEQVWYKGQLGKLEARITFGDEAVQYGIVLFELERGSKRIKLTEASVQEGLAVVEDFKVPETVPYGESKLRVTYQGNDEYQKSTAKNTVIVKEILS